MKQHQMSNDSEFIEAAKICADLGVVSRLSPLLVFIGVSPVSKILEMHSPEGVDSYVQNLIDAGWIDTNNVDATELLK